MHMKSGIEEKQEIHYRHEWKHEISWSDLLSIRQRLPLCVRIVVSEAE